MTNYTIVGDEQPGSTENKHFLRSQVSARGLPEGPRRGLQRSRNAIPFDLERDIDHVTHALKFLKSDGYLTAIMSAGTEFRETKKAKAFRRASCS